MILKRMLGRLHREVFPPPPKKPTERELMATKWFTDGGDDRFLFDYNLDRNSLVFDLGGYQGQWASDLFSRYQCPILVFEPVKSFAEKIEKRFRKNELIDVFNHGLGGSSRKETIHICADSSSVFKGSGDTENITIVDVKDFLEERGITKIDLVKINIEGGEYELLERLVETDTTKIIENILVQFHDFFEDSDSRIETIQNNLKVTHTPSYQYKYIWENWTRNAGSDS